MIVFLACNSFLILISYTCNHLAAMQILLLYDRLRLVRLLCHLFAHLVCWNPDQLSDHLMTAHQLNVGADQFPSQHVFKWASVSTYTCALWKKSHAISSTDESFWSGISPQTRPSLRENISWLMFRKHTKTQYKVLVHGILLEKQNVKTSMYNLECRSTEQNSWTGPGLAAPTHAPTQTHTQTQDRNAAKHRPHPHLTEINTPLNNDAHTTLKAIYCIQVCFSKKSQFQQKLILMILPQKLILWIITFNAHPSPPNSLRYTQCQRGSNLCPTQASPSKKVNTQRIKRVSLHARNTESKMSLFIPF